LKETLWSGGYSQSVVANAANNGIVEPVGIAVDGSGSVYVADSYNSRILKETPAAGGYTQSVVADAANSGLSFPAGVAVDVGGNVYITNDSKNEVLKENFADPPILTAIAAGAAGIESPATVTVTNEGNAALIFPVPATGDNPSLTGSFAWDPASTCVQNTSSSSAAFELAAGASCTMEFDFKPTMPGTATGLATLTDNNLNVTGSIQEIQLIGMPGTQTITFPQPSSPVYYGVAPIILSATGGASGNPVIFSVLSGPGSLSGTNNSVLTVTGAGTITIAADQAGNIDYSAAPEAIQSVFVLYSQSAALTAPTPGSTLTGSSATFTWSPGIGATQYMLYLGTTGVRSDNLYNSGPTTATSVSVTGLPVNGQTIYARLYSFIGGTWHALDYIYHAPSLQVALVSPPPNSTLTGSNVTFTWSSVTGVSKYELYLGTNGSGSDNLYHSGITTATSAKVTGLPTNGEKISARLYWFASGTWQFLDYFYTAE